MDLHGQMMNLQTPAILTFSNEDSPFMAYKKGHRDARYAAAELALKADAKIEELREALAYMVANLGQPAALETRDGFNKARALVGVAVG